MFWGSPYTSSHALARTGAVVVDEHTPGEVERAPEEVPLAKQSKVPQREEMAHVMLHFRPLEPLVWRVGPIRLPTLMGPFKELRGVCECVREEGREAVEASSRPFAVRSRGFSCQGVDYICEAVLLLDGSSRGGHVERK